MMIALLLGLAASPYPAAAVAEMKAANVQVARPSRKVSGSIFTTDYPAAAVASRAQGRVVARYVVGPAGRVTECAILVSSGHAELDSTSCQLIEERFFFTPARDSAGNPVPHVLLQTLLWKP
jgi:protein TonB